MQSYDDAFQKLESLHHSISSFLGSRIMSQQFRCTTVCWQYRIWWGIHYKWGVWRNIWKYCRNASGTDVFEPVPCSSGLCSDKEYNERCESCVITLWQRTKFYARQILFKTNTTFTTNGSAVAYEVLQKVRIKCIIQTPNFFYNNWVSDYDGEWNMYIYVLNVQNV
jgi:hypothetical protein